NSKYLDVLLRFHHKIRQSYRAKALNRVQSHGFCQSTQGILLLYADDSFVVKPMYFPTERVNECICRCFCIWQWFARHFRAYLADWKLKVEFAFQERLRRPYSEVEQNLPQSLFEFQLPF